MQPAGKVLSDGFDPAPVCRKMRTRADLNLRTQGESDYREQVDQHRRKLTFNQNDFDVSVCTAKRWAAPL